MKNLPNKSTRIFFVVIALLVLTNAAALIWIYMHPHSIDRVVSEYPLVDPARNFIAQEDFLVNIQPLRESIHAYAEEQEEMEISLYFEFLNTGANISVNTDLAVWPASLLKVPMAMAVMKKIERGEWKLESELVLTERDRDQAYGVLWQRPIGTRMTVDELLREMLGRSDNTAYRMFNRNMDTQELVAVLTNLGMEDLFNSEGLITAKEYSRLFRSLYTSSFLRREHSQYLLSILADGQFKGFVDEGVPNSVMFAHKFGIDSQHGSALDSGIVYVPNRPYLITVAIRTNGNPAQENAVKEFMRRVGEMTYTYVSEK